MNDNDIHNRIQTYFDSDDTITDVWTKTCNRFDVINASIDNLKNKSNQALFSIDMLIKSINNYIKSENEFNEWYYSQSIFRKIIWKIKHKTFKEIREIYNNKKDNKNGDKS